MLRIVFSKVKISNVCLTALVATACAVGSLYAADEIAPPNYDESKVPEFTLPDPLVAPDGSKIETPDQWRQVARPHILGLFKSEMFGQFPEADLSKIKFEEIKTQKDALQGKATRKEIRIYFNYPEKTPKADLMILIPNKVEKPVPAFLMPNFQGNHTTTEDPDVTAVDAPFRTRNAKEKPEDVRGVAKKRWAFEKIIDRGYAVATVYYEEIEPDQSVGFKYGVHPLFSNFDLAKDDYPATIGAWAWGLSRALDCLETVPEIDASKVIVAGHSRLGKTALWCGANDERFAAVISNNSGCGGAALSRREFGERIDRINASFPHWFTKKFHTYGARVNELPIDEHELIALIAPRPVYVASANEDQWADPKGEFLSCYYADPVYKLLGTPGFGGVDTLPDLNKSVGATIRYHKRTGVHDVTDFDWEMYLDFADAVFGR